MPALPEPFESLSIRAALGNNGGSWAEHYQEPQRDHWRRFVLDLVEAERQRCAGIARKQATANAVYCDAIWTIVEEIESPETLKG